MMRHLNAYLQALPRIVGSPHTVTQYGLKLRQLFAWLESYGRPLDEAALADYIRDRQTEGRKRPRTIRTLRPALASFFRWAKGQGHVSSTPDLKDLPWPKLDRPQRYIPTDADLDALEKAADHMPGRTLAKRYRRARAQAVLALFRYTGLRRRELLSLQVADIRKRADGRWLVYVACGKGAQSDWVPLCDLALTPVMQFLQVREEWLVGRNAVAKVKQGLWPVDRSRVLDDYGLTELFRDLVDSAKLDRRITPHCLRHWYCTDLLQGADLATVSRLMRHSSLDVTIDYCHWNEERMDAAVDRFDKRRGAGADTPTPRGSTPRPLGEAQEEGQPNSIQRRRLSRRPRRN